MSVADLTALVKRVGTTAASRATGLPRATLYGRITNYARKGKQLRTFGALPVRGAIRRPEVVAAVSEPVTLVVMLARAIVIREDEETGELVADPDPRVVDFVYGDAYDEGRDRTFTAMYFEQEPPASVQEVETRLTEYFAIKQQALEQATDRPPRPYVKRKGVVVENLGSPSGAVIVGVLWRYYHGKDRKERATVKATPWLRPSAAMRAEQAAIMGAEKVRLAYATYEEHRPRRGPNR
jgi:hypothetical protein